MKQNMENYNVEKNNNLIVHQKLFRLLGATIMFSIQKFKFIVVEFALDEKNLLPPPFSETFSVKV